jgi:ribosomal protein S18 acetylase RimI-like enzyme
VFVAVERERCLGMAGGFFAAEERETATLWGMWVDPGARRRGLGRELVEAVAAWARVCGARRLRLAVTDCDASRPAAALYGELGFVETGEHEELASDPSLTALVMLRSL